MLSSHANRRYAISEYQPEWPSVFEKESQRIKEALGDNVIAIEHVGSTSVPGMAGKACIDMEVLVKDISHINEYERKLKSLGYEPLGEFITKDAFFFGKEKNHERILNIQIMEAGHSQWRETIAVRDYLRSRPDEVKSYSDLKRSLFNKYADDYGSYRREKNAYMKDLQVRVHLWANINDE